MRNIVDFGVFNKISKFLIRVKTVFKTKFKTVLKQTTKYELKEYKWGLQNEKSTFMSYITETLKHKT